MRPVKEMKKTSIEDPCVPKYYHVKYFPEFSGIFRNFGEYLTLITSAHIALRTSKLTKLNT